MFGVNYPLPTPLRFSRRLMIASASYSRQMWFMVLHLLFYEPGVGRGWFVYCYLYGSFKQKVHSSWLIVGCLQCEHAIGASSVFWVVLHVRHLKTPMSISKSSSPGSSLYLASFLQSLHVILNLLRMIFGFMLERNV